MHPIKMVMKKLIENSAFSIKNSLNVRYFVPTVSAVSKAFKREQLA
jgi:hypothetical protein